MFALTVVEHLRLNFDLVVQNYTVHAKAAERLTDLAARTRLAVLALLATAVAAMVLSLVRTDRGYQVAAAIIGGVALAGQVLSIAFALETRVHTHRSFAHRLWLMCERYRSLLAEINDGLIDEATILRRRDDLTEQVHAIYEHGFAADQRAYERLRQLAPQTEITSDDQIDQRHAGSARRAS